MHNKAAEFNAGLELLNMLTDGTVHLQTRQNADDVFLNAKNVQNNIVKRPLILPGMLVLKFMKLILSIKGSYLVH